MLEVIILISILIGLGTLFVANVYTYREDEVIIREYCRDNGLSVEAISSSVALSSINREKFKEIQGQNRWEELIIIGKNGPMISSAFYTVRTKEKDEVELLVSNSVMFFIKPRIYVCHDFS